MGEHLKISDFGYIEFYIPRRHYSADENGKLTYKTVKEPFCYEGVEITDSDKSRIWIEGIDKDIHEIFNIRRSQVISFKKMERPFVNKNI